MIVAITALFCVFGMGPVGSQLRIELESLFTS